MQSYRISYWYLACFSNCALCCISKRTTKCLFTIDTCTVNDHLSASTIFHPYYGPISMVHFVSLLITDQSAQCVLVNRSLGTNQLSVLSWTAHRFFHLLPWFDLSVLSISSQMNMKGSKAELCEAYPMWPNLIMTDAMPSQLILAFDYNEHGDSWHHTIRDTYTGHVTPEVMQLLSEFICMSMSLLESMHAGFIRTWRDIAYATLQVNTGIFLLSVLWEFMGTTSLQLICTHTHTHRVQT